MSRLQIIVLMAGFAIGVLLLLWLTAGGGLSRGNPNVILSGSFTVEWDDLSRKYMYNSGLVPERLLEGAAEEDNLTRGAETEQAMSTASSQHSEIPTSSLSSPNTQLGYTESLHELVDTHPSDNQSIKTPLTDSTRSPVAHILPSVPGQQPIPFMGDYNCSNQLCKEFLTERDLKKTNCVKTMTTEAEKFPGKCHFMNGTNRPAVYLMSYPGSGNTWVRGLLEQATGICTGAIYCDGGLKRGGFNGENVNSGAVLVTKSHNPFWPPQHKLGILLLRNPLDAYVAEWNRQHSGHTGQADRTLFGNNSMWNRFTHHFAMSPWVSHFKWLVKGLQTGRRVLVVRYEDLKSDLMTQMKRMLEFLGVPYSDEALQRRMSNNFGKFHRQHSNSTDFDHYTPEQREHIRGLVKEAIEILKRDNNGITYGVEEYLQ